MGDIVIFGQTIGINFLIGNLFGFGAAAMTTLSFQRKDNRGLAFLQFIAALLFGTQYVLLGSWSGLIFNILTALRCLALYFGGKFFVSKKMQYVMLALYTAAIIFAFAVLHEWEAIFSYLALTISTIAMWTHNGKTIRLVQLCIISPCWILFDIFTLAIAGLICELIATTSVVVSIIRYGLDGFEKSPGKK